jgi:hypothetical protein
MIGGFPVVMKENHSSSVMTDVKHKKTSHSEQIRAFRKAAREAGCDDNEERFQDALRRVAKAKPSKKPPKRREQ